MRPSKRRPGLEIPWFPPRYSAYVLRPNDHSAPPDVVWPWLVQLCKGRAGWYLAKRVERLIPRSRRALRRIDPRRQDTRPGDVIPDYGGRRETFAVHQMVQDSVLVFTSRRGRTDIIWSIRLRQVKTGATRVLLRLRLGPLRRKWLVVTVGELIDLLTIAGLAAGLEERVRGVGEQLRSDWRRSGSELQEHSSSAKG